MSVREHRTDCGDDNQRNRSDDRVFVFLDNALTRDGASCLLEHPERVIRCWSPQEVDTALSAVEEAVGNGCYAAGFFSYELGYLFEPRLAALLPVERRQPLIWMGLFRHCRQFSPAEATAWVREHGHGNWRISGSKAALDGDDYRKLVEKILDYIAQGDVYQINFTFPWRFSFSGDPLALFAHLRRQQPVAYGAILADHDFHILSLSPELFLQVSEGQARSRPMKGTLRRGVRPDEDARLRTALMDDPKSRAENLMIVDLMRNDLGRIAEIGGVRVTDLFTVETYRGLHQMTSGISAKLRTGVGLIETLRTVFPCGSVTGAPKIRAMEIIRELERRPRGVYTGAIGLIAPNGDMRFNVAIRTVVLEANGEGELGVGSGLVADSVATAEYDECALKAAFVFSPTPAFSLIETVRWCREQGFYLRARHLARLAASADYFRIDVNLGQVEELLDRTAAGLAGPCYRVRLLLDQEGSATVTAEPMAWPPAETPGRYVFSPQPVDPEDPFLYHKTTLRSLYDREFARLQALTGCTDVLFVNARGEVTESSRANVFIERDGRLLTPPVECGLLDGTLRRELLENASDRVTTAVLRPEDLRSADRVLLGNSVRGLFVAVPI